MLTPAEFAVLLERETKELPPETRSVYHRYAGPPVRMVHSWDFGGRQVSKPVWVIARAGPRIVGYDEVEEEFGTGVVLHEGVVEDWVIYGERLQWALLRFPDAEHGGTGVGDPQPVA